MLVIQHVVAVFFLVVAVSLLFYSVVLFVNDNK